MKNELLLYIDRNYIKQIYDKLIYIFNNTNYGYNYFYQDNKNNIHIILLDELEKTIYFFMSNNKVIYRYNY